MSMSRTACDVAVVDTEAAPPGEEYGAVVKQDLFGEKEALATAFETAGARVSGRDGILA